jgi:SET domain-containing protein
MPPDITVRRSPIHGHGVFAARNLPAGRELIEYGGALLTHDEADERYGGNIEEGHTFLFTLNDDYVVDGATDGNDARFINHSCEPNCHAVLLESEDGNPAHDRIGIETLRPIKKGEEITFDYGIVLAVRHTARLKKRWQCLCGAETCSGTLLKPKRARG